MSGTWLPVGIAAGWAAERVLPDPARRHPVAGIGTVADRLEASCWRDHRAAGVAHTAAVVGGTTAVVAAADTALRTRPAARAALTAAVVWAALGGRSLRLEATTMAEALEAGDLPAARARLPHLCGRDPAGLDTEGLARATIESVAENTADAVVGTLSWAALAGPAGAAGHRAANTLDAMVGHRTRRHARFGWSAARLDDLLGWVPARLTAWGAVALATTVGGRTAHAATILRRDGRAHPSPNAGPCEAAWAGALERRLGGATNRYGDHLDARPAQGDGPAPDAADVRRAVRLAARVEVLALLLALAVTGARATVARPTMARTAAAGRRR